MKQSLRHLFLIFGTVSIVMGSLTLFTEEMSKQSVLFGGGLFTAGVYLISKTLSKAGTRTRRDIRIKEMAKERYSNEEE
ncbi:MAG: hypothetical protein ACI9N1_000441 [Flavobacteriales bacterium]|jgi:hypothetical protein